MRRYEHVGEVPAGLFQGSRGRPVGEAIKVMAERGRHVVSSQTTRWAENRATYRGHPNVMVTRSSTGQLRVVSRDRVDHRGRRRRPVNISKGLVNGRVSLLTRLKPVVEVLPQDLGPNAIEAARVAENLVDGMWGTKGWDLSRVLRDLARGGEIDGVQFLYVGWDPEGGPRKPVPYVAETRQPVPDPGTWDLLRTLAPDGVDEQGNEVWFMGPGMEPLGDVEIRVVKPGAMFVDPYMTDAWGRARYAGESRVRPRVEVEAAAGMSLEELFRLSAERSGRPVGRHEAPRTDAALGRLPEEPDDEQAFNRGVTGEDVVVHCMYVLPGGDWPAGAYLEWVKGAEGAPLVAEPYQRECLPYRPFTPSPDGGNLLRSLGTMDDLSPVVREFNDVLAMLSDWMRLASKPPVGIPEGGLVSSSVFNEDGFFVFRAGLGDPRFMPVPSEPGAMATSYLGTLQGLAGELSVQPAAARGMEQQGVSAAVTFNTVAQRVEDQLSPTEQELRGVLEWALSEALQLVADYYTHPRYVTLPGFMDTAEVAAFKGSMIRGATRVRVVGTMMPKQRAATIQMILQLLPMLGAEVKPFLGQLVDGDPSAWLEAQDQHKKRQRRENRTLVGLATFELLEPVWVNFQQDLALFSEAVQVAAQDPSRPPDRNPVDHAAQRLGSNRPPRLLDDLRAAGARVPVVEQFDDHAQHVLALTEWCVTEAFERLPDPVKQATREHLLEHLEKLTAGLASQEGLMGGPPAGPEGSAPKELGTPSQPAQRGSQSPAPDPAPVSA